MDEITEMSLSELEVMLDESKERLLAEDLSEEERAEIEKTITVIKDQIEILSTKAYQAAREAARLDPEQPANPIY